MFYTSVGVLSGKEQTLSMRRKNPKTNKPFTRGCVREDGYIFLSYHPSKIKQNGFFAESWVKPEVYEKSLNLQRSANALYSRVMRQDPVFRAKVLLRAARNRSKKSGGKVTISVDYIIEKLKNGKCELTDLPFDLSPPKNTQKNPFGPSLDRIDSKNKNYEDGNVRVVLQSVNMALSEYGIDHLILITDALKKVLQKNRL